MKNFTILLVILLLLWGSQSNGQEDKIPGESAMSIDSLKTGRGKLFDEGNFGMFIHWGLFSHLGGKWQDKTYYGIGEWIMHPAMAGIPVNSYKSMAKEFNPVTFDARAIAGLPGMPV